MLEVIKTETEIIVPDTISLKGESTERVIRLEECQSQNEVIEYLKLCLSLSSIFISEKTTGEYVKSIINLQTTPKKYSEISESAYMKMSMA
jgi:hypothetical protein